MNILREISRGGKGKLLNTKCSTLDFGTMTATALHEPNVDTKKVVFFKYMQNDCNLKVVFSFIQSFKNLVVIECDSIINDS